MNFKKFNKKQLNEQIEININVLEAIEFTINTSKSTFHNDLEAGLITKDQYEERIEELKNFYAPRIEILNNENYEIREILRTNS